VCSDGFDHPYAHRLSIYPRSHRLDTHSHSSDGYGYPHPGDCDSPTYLSPHHTYASTPDSDSPTPLSQFASAFERLPTPTE
jgi:hypothetical protein